MNETNPLEKQLQSWTPRRPSPKIRARLFGTPRQWLLAPGHLWNWLTPAAACVLTLLVALTGSMRHPVELTPAGSAAIASLMYDPEASNTPRTFILSRMDLNVEWNIWPHLAPARSIINTTHFVPSTNHSSVSGDL